MIPTTRRQWTAFLIGGKRGESKRTASTVKSNGKNSLFVLSIYGMFGKVAQVLLRKLGLLKVKKMGEPVSHMCGWINGRIRDSSRVIVFVHA